MERGGGDNLKVYSAVHFSFSFSLAGDYFVFCY